MPKQYKVFVSETDHGYRIIEADSAQEAEQKYYDGEYSVIESPLISKGGEYLVTDTEEIEAPEVPKLV